VVELADPCSAASPSS